MEKAMKKLIIGLFHPLTKYSLHVLVVFVWYQVFGVGGAIVAAIVPLLLLLVFKLGSEFVE